MPGWGNMKALAMCEQNSTAIPTQMTRLTSETAFKLTPHSAIIPIMSITIMPTTTVMQRPVRRLPRSRELTRNIATNAERIKVSVRRYIVAYWSKKM